MSKSEYLYGAEYLKAKAVHFTFIAITVSCTLVLGMFLIPKIQKWLSKEEESTVVKVQAKKVINYAELSAPPPIDLEQAKPPPKKVDVKIKTVKFLQPVAKKDEEVPDEELIPTMDEMEHTQIGAKDQEGVDSIVFHQEEAVEVEYHPEAEMEPYSFVQKMPEFFGGSKALIKYLSENISYPAIAKDAGIEGTVYINFVVEPDGTISNEKVLRSVHPSIDKEALKVIAQMPKWQAGEQNGQFVRVSFTIPVRFYLKDK